MKSPFFRTLYDGASSTSSVTRIADFSIVEALCWKDDRLQPLEEARVHRFALIAADGPDPRIGVVLQRMLRRGLIAPVHFIGTRKGNLSVLLSRRSTLCKRSLKCKDFERLVSDCARDVCGDSWRVMVDIFDVESDDPDRIGFAGMLNVPIKRAKPFFDGLQSAWSLGFQPASAHNQICWLE